MFTHNRRSIVLIHTSMMCIFCSGDEMQKVTRVRLDREHIGSIDNLMLFSDNVTNVYVQHVRITVL